MQNKNIMAQLSAAKTSDLALMMDALVQENKRRVFAAASEVDEHSDKYTVHTFDCGSDDIPNMLCPQCGYMYDEKTINEHCKCPYCSQPANQPYNNRTWGKANAGLFKRVKPLEHGGWTQ